MGLTKQVLPFKILIDSFLLGAKRSLSNSSAIIDNMKNHLYLANLLANTLDNKFNLFGLRFGASAIIDLIPGFGDMIDALLSLYIVWIAVQIHIPNREIIKMVRNILFSFLIGLIPLFGDMIYIFYRPNIRNISIIKKYTV